MSQKDKILALLEQLDKNPKRSLGQNFLIDGNIIEKILREVESFPAKHIVEIGPGAGSLTNDLLVLSTKQEKTLELIELDQGFFNYWKDKVSDIHEIDVLKFSWNPYKDKELCIVSNLPYQVSSRLIIELSLLEWKQDIKVIFMFQKEVAQRIQATANSEHYGLLSVVVQSFWKVQKLCDVSPRCFWPAPNVTSRVLTFSPLRAYLMDETKRKNYLSFLKLGFAQRRKLLRKNLGAYRKDVDLLWSDSGIDDKARAEDLSIQQWVQLYEHLKHT